VTGPINFVLMAAAYSAILHFLKSGKFDLAEYKTPSVRCCLESITRGFLIGLFALAGFIFCILPGLIVQSLYLFPLLLILDKKLTFWEAMEESRKKVQKNLWGFVGFSC